jgi:hypothetical protein
MKHFLFVAAICLIATPMLANAEPTMREALPAMKPHTASINMATEEVIDGVDRLGDQIWAATATIGWFMVSTQGSELTVDHGDIEPDLNQSRQWQNNIVYHIDGFLMAYATDVLSGMGPTGTVAWYGGFATGWHLGGNPRPLPDPNTAGQYFLAAFGLNLHGSDFGPNYPLAQGWLITYTLWDPNGTPGDPNDFRFWIFGPDFYNGITDPNDPNFNNDIINGIDFGYAFWFDVQPHGTRMGPLITEKDDVNAPGMESFWAGYEGNDPWVDPNVWFDDHWAFVTLWWFGDPNLGYPFGGFTHALWGDRYEVGCPTPGASGNYCTADLTGDCQVTVGDLGVLLGVFGSCPGDPDYNQQAGELAPADPCVTVGDLGVLLGQFNDNCN